MGLFDAADASASVGKARAARTAEALARINTAIAPMLTEARDGLIARGVAPTLVNNGVKWWDLPPAATSYALTEQGRLLIVLPLYSARRADFMDLDPELFRFSGTGIEINARELEPMSDRVVSNWIPFETWLSKGIAHLVERHARNMR